MNTYRTAWTTRLLVLLGLAFMLFPLLAVIPVSFTSKRYLSMPKGNWSLRHYQALLDNPDWASAIGQSLLIAFITAVVATLLVVAFALGVWYLRSKLALLLVGLCMLPLAIPPVISSMVLYFMETSISKVVPGLGYDTIPGVVLAHVLMVAPFGIIAMLVALGQLDRRMEMAARNLGASTWQTIYMVLLPNLKLGIASTALLAFALSWEEIAVTLFITSFDVITLPRQIWSGLRDNVDPSIAAISVILIGITLLALAGRALVQHYAARGQHEG